MTQSHPKRFTPIKKPKAPSNTGIFSNSGKGQKVDPQVNSARDKAILNKAVNGHRNTTARADTK